MLKENGKNSLKKGEVIFESGDEVKQVGIILSGKVMMQGECVKLELPQGSFIGLNGIFETSYTNTYTVLENSVIYAIPVDGEKTLRNIINKSADYRAIMMSSQFRIAVELYKLKTSLVERAERLSSFATRSYNEYKELCRDFGILPIGLDELEELSPLDAGTDENEYRMPYYEEAAKIPLGANKVYFSYSEEMVNFQTKEIMELMAAMFQECSQATDYIKKLLDIVALRKKKNLYDYICQKAAEIQKKDDLPVSAFILINGVIDEVSLQYRELENQCSDMSELDIEELKSRMGNMATASASTVDEEKTTEEKLEQLKRDMESLDGSMAQILRFAAFDADEGETLTTNVNYIVEAPDKLSVDDGIKKAKKAITPLVFKLYLECYRKIRQGLVETPKAVELFMNYGMLDERLLDREQLEFLCGIEPEKNDGPCKVVTMPQWLDMIYDGKREPSKNEFDEDYDTYLRNLKKQGDITEAEYKKMTDDSDKRVEFEVMNMQASNSKVVYGQPSSYMPILFKEAMFGSIDKLLLTKAKVNDSVKRLKKTDYSVFYREVIFSDNKLKIINETVMQEVYPDIILMPIFGTNGSMWQEVGGKNKGTPGRFCFPIMTGTDIDEMMLKMFGRFRWELCRCIQGMSWNDVKVKSLTSEYMDYIQFYRKNRDLSDDAKDKIKLQIQKARNNSRETFLIDYEAWMKNESNGSMKLNKVAREMMATYCPFSKEIRERLGAQKPYEVAQERATRTALKKRQEWDIKIKSLQKVTNEVPKEMTDTYSFYADM